MVSAVVEPGNGRRLLNISNSTQPNARCPATSRDRVADPQRAPREAIAGRRALDQLEDKGGDSGGLLESVNRRDRRMVQRGEQAGFTGQARQAFRIRRDGVGQDLERDVPPETGGSCAR
jgi:hypothetical protein